jgi:hypothetical protein
MGRRKDVLLFVLAVAALVVAVYTFRKPAPSTAPKADTAVATKTKHEKKAGEAESGKKAQEVAGPTGALPATSATRSPFEGPGAAGVTEAGKKPEATTGKNPAAKPQQPPLAAAPMQGGPKPTSAPGKAQASPAGKQGTASGQTLTLNGVLAGRQAMAVIRQGDQRYYVRAGDRVDRYRVQSISQKEVVLVGSEGKVILRMGGRQ